MEVRKVIEGLEALLEKVINEWIEAGKSLHYLIRRHSLPAPPFIACAEALEGYEERVDIYERERWCGGRLWLMVVRDVRALRLTVKLRDVMAEKKIKRKLPQEGDLAFVVFLCPFIWKDEGFSLPFQATEVVFEEQPIAHMVDIKHFTQALASTLDAEALRWFIRCIREDTERLWAAVAEIKRALDKQGKLCEEILSTWGHLLGDWLKGEEVLSE